MTSHEAEPGQELRSRLACQASLGAFHAIRNALQVVQAYVDLLKEPKDSGHVAIHAGLERTLEIMVTMEGLLGTTSMKPFPHELLNALKLLPEIFIFSLRKKGIPLEIRQQGTPKDSLLNWDLLLLAALLIDEILASLSEGMGGKISLFQESDGLCAWWEPEPGTLPFPLFARSIQPQIPILADALDLAWEILPGSRGYRLFSQESKI